MAQITEEQMRDITRQQAVARLREYADSGIFTDEIATLAPHFADDAKLAALVKNPSLLKTDAEKAAFGDLIETVLSDFHALACTQKPGRTSMQQLMVNAQIDAAIQTKAYTVLLEGFQTADPGTPASEVVQAVIEQEARPLFTSSNATTSALTSFFQGKTAGECNSLEVRTCISQLREKGHFRTADNVARHISNQQDVQQFEVFHEQMGARIADIIHYRDAHFRDLGRALRGITWDVEGERSQHWGEQDPTLGKLHRTFPDSDQAGNGSFLEDRGEYGYRKKYKYRIDEQDTRESPDGKKFVRLLCAIDEKPGQEIYIPEETAKRIRGLTARIAELNPLIRDLESYQEREIRTFPTIPAFLKQDAENGRLPPVHKIAYPKSARLGYLQELLGDDIEIVTTDAKGWERASSKVYKEKNGLYDIAKIDDLVRGSISFSSPVSMQIFLEVTAESNGAFIEPEEIRPSGFRSRKVYPLIENEAGDVMPGEINLTFREHFIAYEFSHQIYNVMREIIEHGASKINPEQFKSPSLVRMITEGYNQIIDQFQEMQKQPLPEGENQTLSDGEILHKILSKTMELVYDVKNRREPDSAGKRLYRLAEKNLLGVDHSFSDLNFQKVGEDEVKKNPMQVLMNLRLIDQGLYVAAALTASPEWQVYYEHHANAYNQETKTPHRRDAMKELFTPMPERSRPSNPIGRYQEVFDSARATPHWSFHLIPPAMMKALQESIEQNRDQIITPEDRARAERMNEVARKQTGIDSDLVTPFDIAKDRILGDSQRTMEPEKTTDRGRS